MIKKNIKYGKVENVTLVEFGKGDVIVAITKFKKRNVGVCFTNLDHPQRIGSFVDTTATNTNELGIDAILTFTDVNSIDVVLQALQIARKELLDQPTELITRL